jgi:hypothetical protein
MTKNDESRFLEQVVWPGPTEGPAFQSTREIVRIAEKYSREAVAAETRISFTPAGRKEARHELARPAIDNIVKEYNKGGHWFAEAGKQLAQAVAAAEREVVGDYERRPHLVALDLAVKNGVPSARWFNETKLAAEGRQGLDDDVLIAAARLPPILSGLSADQRSEVITVLVRKHKPGVVEAFEEASGQLAAQAEVARGAIHRITTHAEVSAGLLMAWSMTAFEIYSPERSKLTRATAAAA